MVQLEVDYSQADTPEDSSGYLLDSHSTAA